MTFPDFEEFIALLGVHRVRYLIVGGYAVGFHARPRATKDLDVLVDRTAANAARVQRALADFLGEGALSDITLDKLQDPTTLIVLGRAPVRIDLLTGIDGVTSFRAAWSRRAIGRYGATAASFISAEDLLRAKLASGRPQDLVDADVLRRAAARRRR